MRARRDLSEMFLSRGFEFNKEHPCDQCGQGLGSTLRLSHHTDGAQRSPTYKA